MFIDANHILVHLWFSGDSYADCRTNTDKKVHLNPSRKREKN